jgi:hypothetical protein
MKKRISFDRKKFYLISSVIVALLLLCLASIFYFSLNSESPLLSGERDPSVFGHSADDIGPGTMEGPIEIWGSLAVNGELDVAGNILASPSVNGFDGSKCRMVGPVQNQGITAYCEVDEIVVGGGINCDNDVGGKMTASFPIIHAGLTGWTGMCDGEPYAFYIYAICCE